MNPVDVKGLTSENAYASMNPQPRSGFRIQQELPHDPTKKSITKGSQITLLAFLNKLGVKNLMYKGKAHTGQELLETFTDLHDKLYQAGVKRSSGCWPSARTWPARAEGLPVMYAVRPNDRRAPASRCF